MDKTLLREAAKKVVFLMVSQKGLTPPPQA